MMQIINISGVPMSGKSVTGDALVKRLNGDGYKSVFIDVDELISDADKNKTRKMFGDNKEAEIKENENIKRKHLLDLIHSYEQSGKYSVVVFSCLMTNDFRDVCDKLYGDHFRSISLVPPMYILLNKRGHRTPSKKTRELIKKMYQKWGFDKPTTADLIVDNSNISVGQSVSIIMDFLHNGGHRLNTQVPSFNNAAMGVVGRLKKLFHINKFQNR